MPSRMKTSPSEGDITREIRAFLTAAGAYVWKVWQGPMSRPRGVSDLIGCWRGRFLAIEVKRPGGKTTLEQECFLAAIRRRGGIAIVARSVQDVVDGLGLHDRFEADHDSPTKPYRIKEV